MKRVNWNAITLGTSINNITSVLQFFLLSLPLQPLLWPLEILIFYTHYLLLKTLFLLCYLMEKNAPINAVLIKELQSKDSNQFQKISEIIVSGRASERLHWLCLVCCNLSKCFLAPSYWQIHLLEDSKNALFLKNSLV